MTLTKPLLKVACIGAGYFSQFHYEAWDRIKGVEIVGSLDQNIENAQRTGFQPFTDLATMLEQAKPDILDIITPPHTHLEFIRQAVKSDLKAVICQKAFCSSLEEAKEAAALSKASGIPLIIHENFRFQPWYRAMKQELDKGTLGRIHQLSFRMRTGDGQGPDAYLERQPYFQKMERFLIHETGVHWIDTFRYLMGEPKSVFADLRQMNPHIAGEDACYVIMEFPEGKRAILDANRNLDHKSTNHRLTFGECLLEGELGTISLSGDGTVSLRRFQENNTNTLLEAQSWAGFAGDCVFSLQNHVIEGLNKIGSFENTIEDYLHVIEIEQATYQSAKVGAKIGV